MPIEKVNIGRHKDIICITDGNNDILFQTLKQDNQYRGLSIINVPNADKRNLTGLSLDDGPKPAVILKFNDPNNINILIKQLEWLKSLMTTNAEPA